MRNKLAGVRTGGILAGCLVAVGVIVVLLVIGGVILALNWRSWTSKGMQSIVQAAVDKSTLPEAEKQEVLAVVDEFTAEFEAGDVTASQFGRVFEELTKSPLIPAMLVMSVDSGYIAKSELTPEEKTEGSKNLSRFVRGVFDGSISQTKIDDVTEPIHAEPNDANKVSIHTNNINLELKAPESVKPEELRAFLANADAEADAAGVPDERFEVDWSAELQSAIDRAMGRAPAEPAETPEPEGEPGGG